jgi:uncharacterized protein YbjT (DUF2867 family)
MYAITGVTGKVGAVVARTLLAQGKPVRAIVRDRMRANTWVEQGCEIVTADLNDSKALTVAFKGAEAVFILPPSEFDPSPDFAEARQVIDAVFTALKTANPARVVCLSTIGAQATETNLLSQRTLMEQALRDLPMAVTFLRPGWFMENAAWDVAPARENGVIQSFLQPLDQPVPMVATADVGRIAAELMMQPANGKRIVELEGANRISPRDIATTFASILGHSVSVEAVPRDSWEAMFRLQGMKQPMPRMRMLDGFNEQWIAFEGPEKEVIKGKVELETVLRTLICQDA